MNLIRGNGYFLNVNAPAWELPPMPPFMMLMAQVFIQGSCLGSPVGCSPGSARPNVSAPQRNALGRRRAAHRYVRKWLRQRVAGSKTKKARKAG